MNIFIASGHLGKDMELKTAANGNTYLDNSLAVKSMRKNNQGEYETDWFNIRAFGKTAEVMARTLSKGRKIMINGSIQVNETENNQGERRTYYNVMVNTFEYADSKPDYGQQQPYNQPGGFASAGDEIHISDDNLPF